MGKNLQQQEPLISLEHHNPGCIKGIFHHFNHRKWYNVKKRLPYKRNHSGKQSTDIDQVQEKFEIESAKFSTHGKSSESGSGHKSSMKSRIKALIPEEVYRRRGRHHRTSSCPTQIPVDKAPSIHQVDVSGLDPRAETGLWNESLDQQENLHSLVSSLLDPLLPRVSGESVTTSKTCHLCATMLTKNYLKQSEVNELGKQPVKDHTLLQNELVYAIEPSKIASLQESKLFFDALDLLNIRKELFLKVLQDPNSSLSHHLHSQRATTSRLGLTKSVSFPMAGSSRRGDPSNSPRSKKEGGSSAEGETEPQVCSEDTNANALTSSGVSQENSVIETGTCADGETSKQLFLRTDSLDNTSVGSPKDFKKQQVNKLIIKRFKSLREKIKYAIKESRTERQRIVMDGFLHKIPYGLPKNTKEDKIISALVNSGADGIKRTSSFNESLSAYHQLVESQFNKETNNHISDKSKLRTAGGSPVLLARIHSLPDMRSYSFSHIERTPTTNSSSEISKRPSFSGSLNSENSSLVNKKLVALKNQITLSDSSENDCHEKIQELGESLNDLGSFKRRVNITDQDNSIKPISDFVHESKMEDATALPSRVEDSELAQVAELPAEDQIFNKDDSSPNQHREFSMDSPLSFENKIKVNITDAPPRQSYNDLLRVQVDMKNRADFNFVRDVLELSGFSGTEFLGKWHSVEHPVDPLVFDEVEGCLLAQPICSGNEKGGSYNHLLLFDLINEVLLEIYGRTFSYWPKPLTCCSHVHPMPVGYHVLEDVWASINWYLRRRLEVDPSLDDAVNHDLSKSDGWMNIQFEAECVGIELEEWIFDDLLDELVFS